MRIGHVKIDYLNKTFLYDALAIEAKVGDTVVIETDFGLDTGMLVEEIVEAEPEPGQPQLHKILRIATLEDVARVKSMAETEVESLAICIDEVHKSRLDMKLINARYSFDGSKVTFCYTAENRVDFRQLVRTLASRLRTRIELRQVGVRDEARLFGGIGQCGRPLCCATFLNGFEPVSIRMAKEQGLPLNPLKISGICGRLFCCLKYEYDYYREVRRKLPKFGDEFVHEDKKVRVLNVNPLTMSVYVEDQEGQRSNVKLTVTFEAPSLPARKKCAACPSGHSQREHGDDYDDDDMDGDDNSY